MHDTASYHFASRSQLEASHQTYCVVAVKEKFHCSELAIREKMIHRRSDGGSPHAELKSIRHPAASCRELMKLF